MQYRYLDIRRTPVRENLVFRSQVSLAIRNYLSQHDFIDVETPYLIKSTPEVPAILWSLTHEWRTILCPPTITANLWQLLMVGGMDNTSQIGSVSAMKIKSRPPTRIYPNRPRNDFEQEDVLQQFEGLLSHLLKEIKSNNEYFPRMTYAEAMKKYGNDKPDIRFGMSSPNSMLRENKGFNVFDQQELWVFGAASYTRKQIDKLIDWVKRHKLAQMV